MAVFYTPEATVTIRGKVLGTVGPTTLTLPEPGVLRAPLRVTVTVRMRWGAQARREWWRFVHSMRPPRHMRTVGQRGERALLRVNR